MENRLIYDYYIHGHHLEYLHHLYLGALEDKENNYIFYLPDTFEKEKGKFEWKPQDNVRIVLSGKEEMCPPSGNYLVRSIKAIKQTYDLCKDMKIQIKKFNISSVFLISLFNFLPFLPFVCPRNVRYSGIIYGIYFYYWKSSTFAKKVYDVAMYKLMSTSRCISNVYMLNDSSSACYLNRKHHTNKYKFLPDPVVPLEQTDASHTRERLGIPANDIVFLHLGGMTERKGTLELLDAIKSADEKSLNGKSFIFAGRVTYHIDKRFYEILEQIKNKKVFVYDDFLEYNFIAELCQIADYMIIPYKHTSQSSGIIGYAAQFHIPVIAPGKNLLGKLIRKYKLGGKYGSLRSHEVRDVIEAINATAVSNSNYLSINNVRNFNGIIFSGL